VQLRARAGRGRSRTAVAPLERLKILMQVQGKERVYRGVVQARPPGPLQQCTLRVLERRLLHSRVDGKPG
jgi:hypothetical protein